VIHACAVCLQKRYNREYPAIFGTYQCYLKDSTGRFQDDMDRARRQGYHFAAKLVRGGGTAVVTAA
jgi:proline dehydrogenase